MSIGPLLLLSLSLQVKNKSKILIRVNEMVDRTVEELVYLTQNLNCIHPRRDDI